MSETLEKYLDKIGLSQLWSMIVQNFVKQESGKGLSANDLTDELLNLLGTLESGAQVNVIETVKVNGTEIEVADKAVNILIPTGALAGLDKVSESDLDAALAAIISGKADRATTAAGYGITDVYTKTEVDSKLSSMYKFKGSINFAQIPADGMEDHDAYNIKDAFTTTDAFMEGAGLSYPSGTNIAWVADEGKWDCLAGTYDFSDFAMKSDIPEALTAEEIAAICVFPEE